MKYQVICLLLASVGAQRNKKGDSKAARPDWQDVAVADLKYPTNLDEWKTCDDDADCADKHVCAKHMWAYNGQHESAQGCW